MHGNAESKRLSFARVFTANMLGPRLGREASDDVAPVISSTGRSS
jgi:hypothetical protein